MFRKRILSIKHMGDDYGTHIRTCGKYNTKASTYKVEVIEVYGSTDLEERHILHQEVRLSKNGESLSTEYFDWFNITDEQAARAHYRIKRHECSTIKRYKQSMPYLLKNWSDLEVSPSFK